MNDQNNQDLPHPPAGSDVSRRRRAYLAVAGLAGALGVGAALWRYTPDSGDADANSEVIRNFWSLSLESPAGDPLAMAAFKGRPLLVNFWATWCPPCIEELPLLDAFFKENASNGWQILGIAIDKPASVRDFLTRKPLSFPIAMGGLTGTELGKSLGNASGGLPFSVVLGSSGSVLKRKLGKIYPTDLSQWRSLK